MIASDHVWAGEQGAFEAILANQIFETAQILKNDGSVEKWVIPANGVYTSDTVTQEVVDGCAY